MAIVLQNVISHCVRNDTLFPIPLNIAQLWPDQQLFYHRLL